MYQLVGKWLFGFRGRTASGVSCTQDVKIAKWYCDEKDKFVYKIKSHQSQTSLPSIMIQDGWLQVNMDTFDGISWCNVIVRNILVDNDKIILVVPTTCDDSTTVHIEDYNINNVNIMSLTTFVNYFNQLGKNKKHPNTGTCNTATKKCIKALEDQIGRLGNDVAQLSARLTSVELSQCEFINMHTKNVEVISKIQRSIDDLDTEVKDSLAKIEQCENSIDCNEDCLDKLKVSTSDVKEKSSLLEYMIAELGSITTELKDSVNEHECLLGRVVEDIRMLQSEC